MSKLLIQESPLQVLPSLAAKLGLNEAIVLQQLHYWLNRSAKIIDDKPWIYNTYQGWLKQFPFWSHKTMQRILLSLEKKGLIESATHSPRKSDRTKWYTLNYEGLDTLEKAANAPGQPAPKNGSAWPLHEEVNVASCTIEQRLSLDYLSLEAKREKIFIFNLSLVKK